MDSLRPLYDLYLSFYQMEKRNDQLLTYMEFLEKLSQQLQHEGTTLTKE